MRRALQDKVVVVTGAGSGIGRATALAFAARGCDVAISDVDEEGLEATKVQLESHGRSVHSARLDVSDRAGFEAYAEEVAAHFSEVHVLVNNAGVTVVGGVRDLSIEDIEWVMGVDFWGVVYGTKAFLPVLERSEWGHIVNISSIFGMIAVPNQSAYHAAKFAVRGFTEGLRQELEMSRSRCSVTSVHPGGIRTNIARNARFVRGTAIAETAADFVREFDVLARASPATAAARIVGAVERDQPRLLIGWDARLIDLGQRLFPVAYRKVTKAIASRKP